MADEPMPISWGLGQPKLEPLPWTIIKPHAEQAMRNHGQTLERLRERGGLDPSEAVAILENRRWHRMGKVNATERLALIVRDRRLSRPVPEGHNDR